MTIFNQAKDIIQNEHVSHTIRQFKNMDKNKTSTPGQLRPINKLIGAKIESLRETLGITQAEFAKRVKLSRVSIVNIEAGRQNLNMAQIEQFSRAFGIAPKHLLRGIWF